MAHAVTSEYARYGPVGMVFAIMSVLVAVGASRSSWGALAGIVWEEWHAAPEPSAQAAAEIPDPTPPTMRR